MVQYTSHPCATPGFSCSSRRLNAGLALAPPLPILLILHPPLLLPACSPAGQNVEGWRLSEIKRDDYAPNSQGQRQCEVDRKKWLADRLTGIMKDAGRGGRGRWEAAIAAKCPLLWGRRAPWLHAAVAYQDQIDA